MATKSLTSSSPTDRPAPNAATPAGSSAAVPSGPIGRPMSLELMMSSASVPTAAPAWPPTIIPPTLRIISLRPPRPRPPRPPAPAPPVSAGGSPNGPPGPVGSRGFPGPRGCRGPRGPPAPPEPVPAPLPELEPPVPDPPEPDPLAPPEPCSWSSPGCPGRPKPKGGSLIAVVSQAGWNCHIRQVIPGALRGERPSSQRSPRAERCGEPPEQPARRRPAPRGPARAG